MCFLWLKVLYIIIPPPLPQVSRPGLLCHLLQCKDFQVSQHHTMVRQWKRHDGFTANLLLPSFSLACTRSIFISVHQARDKVRCYRYDKRICNYREDSNAFKNSIPNSCCKRSVVLIPDTTADIIMKNNWGNSFSIVLLMVLFIFPNTDTCNQEWEFVLVNTLALKKFLWKCQCSRLTNSMRIRRK